MEINKVKVLHSFMSLYTARIGFGNGNGKLHIITFCTFRISEFYALIHHQ